MTIKKKILIILSIFFVGTIVLTYLVSYFILQKRFLEIEKQVVRENLDRVSNAYLNDIDELILTNIDWASWDDTYDFISNGNKEYVDSNLVDSTFTTLGLNLMIFVNKQGEIVYESGYDYENEEQLLVPEEINELISKNDILINNTDGISGILLLSDYPVLISSQPILTSNDGGPSRGSLIFGRHLDTKVVADLSERTKLFIDISRLDSTVGYDQYENILTNINKESAYYILPLSSSQISGYTVLDDIYGNPALLLSITQERNIYSQGVKTLITYTTIILLLSLILGVTAIIVLDKVFLKRLIKIEGEVKTIGSNISNRVTIDGSDELSVLSGNINSMLDKLEEAHDEIKYISFHDNLTGLFNRAYFEEELQRLDADRQLPLSVIMGDVNGLKLINDTYGYARGDLLLCRIAEVLKESCREEDIISRWGGDEFVILLPNTTYSDTLEIAERIKQLCEKRSSEELLLSICLGISTKERPEQKVEKITKEAEDMMRVRKPVESKNFKNSILSV